jgi:hypothetical protein
VASLLLLTNCVTIAGRTGFELASLPFDQKGKIVKLACSGAGISLHREESVRESAGQMGTKLGYFIGDFPVSLYVILLTNYAIYGVLYLYISNEIAFKPKDKPPEIKEHRGWFGSLEKNCDEPDDFFYQTYSVKAYTILTENKCEPTLSDKVKEDLILNMFASIENSDKKSITGKEMEEHSENLKSFNCTIPKNDQSCKCLFSIFVKGGLKGLEKSQ